MGEADTAGGGLRRGVLGPLQIAFFVISAAGPLVAMAGGIPLAMLFGNGPGIPMMFVVAALVLLAFSVGYTAMARSVRNAGAFYAFAARGLGGRAAGATGMLALLSYNAIQIGLYGMFGVAAKGLIEPAVAINLPWWLYAVAAWGSIAFFGYRQVDLSAKILGLLVIGEYLVVLVLDVAIVTQGGDAGLSARPFDPGVFSQGSPAIGLMLCFAAFIGFEATTIYSEEARDPERTIPLATYLAVLVIGGFYAVSTWAVVNGAGVDKLMGTLTSLPSPTDLLFALSGRYAAPQLGLAMRVLFVTSIYASLLAFHNAIARYLFAMGREGLLPATLGKTHPRFASPHKGSLAQSVLAVVLIALFAIGGADPVLIVFNLLSAIATLGVIVLMAITALATIRFLSRQGGHAVAVALSVVALVAFVGIAGLATVRFELLTGTQSDWAVMLPLILVVAAGSGVWMTQMLRARDPARFARLGQGAA